jgi:predicted regulator of Ras-like GTPase activity (Roadblock/LC7/MglB family)
MQNDVYSSVLRNTLTEITNACPDIQNIFLFKEDGQIISREETTEEEAAVDAVDALDEVLEKAKVLGGTQSISLEGTKSTLNVSRVNDFYLVTVVPEKADLKYVNIFTNVLLPTVLSLLDKIAPALNQNNLSETVDEEPNTRPYMKPNEEPVEERAENQENHEATEASTEKILPEPQVNQFIVENVGGLFASSDTVRVDSDTMSQWTELYEDKKIEEAMVETFGGKSVRCKLKPLKNAKLEGKGIIQIPEKIQQMLNVGKGELVKVKPVIE